MPEAVILEELDVVVEPDKSQVTPVEAPVAEKAIPPERAADRSATAQAEREVEVEATCPAEAPAVAVVADTAEDRPVVARVGVVAATRER